MIKINLTTAATILLASFVLPRWLYWFQYQIPYIALDSWELLLRASQFHLSTLTEIPLSGSLYLIFLSTTDSLGLGYVEIVYVQQAFMLFASTLLLTCLGQLSAGLWIPSAIAIGLFLANPQTIDLETSILTEALFMPSLLIFGASLVDVLGANKTRGYILAPFALIASILVRPAGLYLAVVILLTIVYLAVRREQKWKLATLAASLLVLALIEQSWPGNHIGNKALRNIAGASFIYWQAKDDYSTELNELIETSRADIKPAEYETYMSSWDPKVLYALTRKFYRRGIWRPVGGTDVKSMCANYESASLNQKWSVVAPMIGDMPFESVKSCPVCYGKFVWANLYRFFVTSNDWSFNFYKYSGRRFKSVAATGIASTQEYTFAQMYCRDPTDGERKFLAKDSAQIGSPNVEFTDEESFLRKVRMRLNHDFEDVSVAETELLRVYRKIYGTHFRPLIANRLIMGVAVFFVCAAAFTAVAKRGRDGVAILVLALAAMLLGAGLLTSMLQPAIPRYVQPTKWIIYVVIVLGIYMLSKLIIDYVTRRVPPHEE